MRTRRASILPIVVIAALMVPTCSYTGQRGSATEQAAEILDATGVKGG